MKLISITKVDSQHTKVNPEEGDKKCERSEQKQNISLDFDKLHLGNEDNANAIQMDSQIKKSRRDVFRSF